MSRQPSAKSVAIRTLLDESKMEMVAPEIRSRLIQMGFEMAPEPRAELDGDVAAFSEAVAKFRGSEARAAQSLGWGDRKLANVKQEIAARKAFKAERGQLDVFKCQYRRFVESRAASPSAPSAYRNGKAVAAAATGRTAPGPRPKYNPVQTTAANPKPKHRPAPLPEEEYAAEVEAMKEIERRGGVAAVHQQQAEIERQRADLQRQLAELDALAAQAKSLLDRFSAHKMRMARLDKEAA